MGRAWNRLEGASEFPESFTQRLGARIFNYRFALATFLIPLGIRAIPEILVGPYPVGWDTMAFYVPTTLYWAAGKAGFLAIVGRAPFIYLVSVPLFLVGVSPVWTFKFMGPILYGLLGLSVYLFLLNSLKWNQKNALGGALVASLYFVTLRIGWDMYRSVAGLSLLLLALSTRSDLDNSRNKIVVVTLIILSIFSDQFSGALSLFVFGVIACLQLLRHYRKQFLDSVQVLIPGVVAFGFVTYAGMTAFNTLYASQPPLGMTWNAFDSVGFLVYAYLPLLPFAILGLRNSKSLEMNLWSFLCLVGVVASSIPALGMQALGFRWALLLTIPLCAYSTAGLLRIAKVQATSLGLLQMIRSNTPRIFAVFLVVFALSYMLLPTEHPGAYFAAYPALMPTSLSQSTIPLSESSGLVALLHWLSDDASPSTVLITHQAIYGWALEYLSPSIPIINYGYGTPSNGVTTAASDGYSSIFLIWWVNGTGWFGQPTVPNAFVRVQSNGGFAVFLYRVDP